MGSDLLPFLTMLIVQLGYAGMNIISKLAMDSGMNPFVHVVYRQIFATIAIAPLAYFLERLERVGLGTKAGQAKMLGTVLCMGGAMLLSFYHGSIVPIDQPNIHWKYAQDMTENKSTTNHGNFMSGPFLLIVSAVSWGVWSIIQARVSMVYPAPYSSSALMCLMASFQCLIVGFCFDHNISDWSLRHSIRVVSAIYAVVVCTSLAYCLMSWCIERKGPLYVSVFNPLLLVIVAVLSWALLEEKIYTIE